MPLYLFQNPKTEEIKEVFQSMNEVHLYYEDSLQWNRVFTKPTASIDTRIDPNNPRDFIEKTKKKNMSIGNMWDESAVLSEQRAKATGRDEIKEIEIKKYEAKTKKKHPSKTKGGILEI
jgi:hypothetical protein